MYENPGLMDFLLVESPSMSKLMDFLPLKSPSITECSVAKGRVVYAIILNVSKFTMDFAS